MATENATTKKGVLIVDDHPLLREGMKLMIDRSEKFRTVGEAGSWEEAVQMAQEAHPDLITMDISLPGRSGIDAVREIRRRDDKTKILMVTMHSRLEYIAEAFEAGAGGYLVKDSTGTRLLDALDTLARGDLFLDGNTSQELVAALVRRRTAERVGGDERYNLLTPREQQVMRLVAEGVPSREIARRLELSGKTVENHRANLMKKLGVHSRMELVKYAARLGLIDVESWK